MDLEQAEKSQASVLVWTRNLGLRDHLFHTLSNWAQETCVDLSLQHQAPFSSGAPAGGILFLDADSLDELQPEQLDQIQNMALVVVSASKQTAIRAYRWHPAAFLAPNAGYRCVRQAMNRCFHFWRQGLKWLDLPYRRNRVRIPLCQLRCVEADGRATILHCAGRQMRANYPLGKLCAQLPSPPFLRCQRGFLVHLGAVKRMAGGTLILEGDRQTISVSRRQVKDVHQTLLSWHALRSD